MYLVRFLLQLNKDTTYSFDQQIMEVIRENPGPYNIYSLVFFKANVLFKCSNPDSPIHVLVEYIDEILESIGKYEAMDFIKILFKDRLNMLDSCLDSRGRTILKGP